MLESTAKSWLPNVFYLIAIPVPFVLLLFFDDHILAILSVQMQSFSRLCISVADRVIQGKAAVLLRHLEFWQAS